MGWFEDLVGKENMKTVKNAYNGSRFKESVDAVDEGIDNAQAFGRDAIKAAQEFKAENAEKAKKGDMWYQTLGKDIEGLKKQAMEEISLLGREEEGPKTEFDTVMEPNGIDPATFDMLGLGKMTTAGKKGFDAQDFFGGFGKKQKGNNGITQFDSQKRDLIAPQGDMAHNRTIADMTANNEAAMRIKMANEMARMEAGMGWQQANNTLGVNPSIAEGVVKKFYQDKTK